MVDVAATPKASEAPPMPATGWDVWSMDLDAVVFKQNAILTG